jgi:hypothetical protein
MKSSWCAIMAGSVQPHVSAAPSRPAVHALSSSRRQPLTAIPAVAAPERQQSHMDNAWPTLNKVFMAAASVGCPAAAVACPAASNWFLYSGQVRECAHDCHWLTLLHAKHSSVQLSMQPSTACMFASSTDKHAPNLGLARAQYTTTNRSITHDSSTHVFNLYVPAPLVSAAVPRPKEYHGRLQLPCSATPRAWGAQQ